jgi:hypothetical protein
VVPLEFIYVQPQEGTVQLIPAYGTNISSYVASVYSGLGFYAFSQATISQWPGAVVVNYTAGFPDGQCPALLVGLIENIAAYRFLSTMGPVLMPYNSIGISIDGTSQSTGTAGPQFLSTRLGELEKSIQAQMERARGFYLKRFLIDYL